MEFNNFNRIHYRTCKIPNFANCLKCSILDVYMNRELDDNEKAKYGVQYGVNIVNNWFERTTN